jgi:hypothetical protein
MNTLSYGFLQPEPPDTGDIFFPGLTANWAQVNNHNHDGSTSAPLATQTQSILSANWLSAAIGGGLYYQTLTVPTGLSFDVCQVWFKLSSGQYVNLSIERVSSTTFNIFINDNTLNLTAYYR